MDARAPVNLNTEVLDTPDSVEENMRKHENSLYNIDTIIQDSPMPAEETMIKSPGAIDRVFKDVHKIEQTLLNNNRKFNIESLKSTASNSTYLLPFNFKKKNLVVTPAEYSRDATKQI